MREEVGEGLRALRGVDGFVKGMGEGVGERALQINTRVMETVKSKKQRSKPHICLI